MAAWTLTDKEWDEVDEFRSSARDARVFRNATIILMTAVGRSKHSIAADLGCCPATVVLWMIFQNPMINLRTWP